MRVAGIAEGFRNNFGFKVKQIPRAVTSRSGLTTIVAGSGPITGRWGATGPATRRNFQINALKNI
jgi:hypothetical protein